jgi:hypothetical protein
MALSLTTGLLPGSDVVDVTPVAHADVQITRDPEFTRQAHLMSDPVPGRLDYIVLSTELGQADAPSNPDQALEVVESYLEAWSPDTIFLTHFGPRGSVRPHLETLWQNLQEMARWVRHTLDEPGSDEERSRAFADRLRQDMRRQMNEVQIAAYPVAAPFEQLWLGLARYWRKRTG